MRLRYKLIVHGRHERMLLAEEAAALAWDANKTKTLLTAGSARALLDQPAHTDLAQIARQRIIAKAIEQMPEMLDAPIAAYARERAKVLSDDHARLRAAAAGSARVTVEPVLPPDVIGHYVLVPAGH
jgi:hypothetical protein